MNDSILNAREERMNEVLNFLSTSHLSILVKANIPGPHKNLGEAHLLVRLFCNELKKNKRYKACKLFNTDDGPFALISFVSNDIKSIKLEMINLEENHELGRFIDLDVFGSSIPSLSRKELGFSLRKCYLCGKDASYCSRNKSHSLDLLLSYIKECVMTYLTKQIELLLIKSMMTELDLEDKFGLVTKSSQGSHPDMNYQMMKKAQQAIIPYFKKLFEIGYQADNLINLLEKTRNIGIDAEQQMLKATGGINAYKGLIFVLGITCLASGYEINHHQNFNSIFENIKTISLTINDDFKNPPITSGLKAYHEYGFMGIRGEVKNGLPSVQSTLKIINPDEKHYLHRCLKQLILISEDTVFLKRSKSMDSYLKFKSAIKQLDISNPDELKSFTVKAISENLSFGGSADLLITTLFLQSIKEFYT